MAIEQTLSIIKPDAVAKNVIGEVVSCFEKAGLKVVASKMMRLSSEQAQSFYAEHKGKVFFNELIEYMTSSAIVVQVLEGEGAIAHNRTLMGATDPKKADQGTLRARFGESITKNAVHGSDSPISAIREISYFFSKMQLCSHL